MPPLQEESQLENELELRTRVDNNSVLMPLINQQEEPATVQRSITKMATVAPSDFLREGTNRFEEEKKEQISEESYESEEEGE